MNDIVNDLRHAISHDSNPWDVTVYERAADEIELLRRNGIVQAAEIESLKALITAWADADDYDEPESDEAYYKAWFALRKAVGR